MRVEEYLGRLDLNEVELKFGEPQKYWGLSSNHNHGENVDVNGLMTVSVVRKSDGRQLLDFFVVGVTYENAENFHESKGFEAFVDEEPNEGSSSSRLGFFSLSLPDGLEADVEEHLREYTNWLT